MTPSFSIRPTRSALKPVLSDDPIAGAEGSTADVFYTPSAQWVARHWELIVALFAGSTLLGAWLISSDAPIQPLRNALILLSFVSAGIPALQQVWSKLRKLRIDIDLLMLLGAGLAAVIGSPFEGALLLFLFALSGALETYALQRTKGALVALRKLMPSDATVMEKDGQVRILVRRITIGATVLVRPGEKIPLDGVVIGGASSVDESAITGESIPRDCAVDDQVFAGTLNLNGRLEFRVTKIAADTTVARIVQLVTEARHHPARAQRLIDRIGPTYTIVVITSAIGMALLGLTILDLPMRESLRRGIALLIVGSPCALIIATPVAYLSAMAAAARRGVLVKGGAHLEVVARARVVAFDKTGTLTTGQIQLTNFEMLTGVDDLEGLRLAASVEASSSHPLAEAVNKAARDKGLSPYDISNYEAIAGEGELATVDGKTVWIGRPEAALQQIQDSLNERVAARCREFRKEGKTVSVLVAGDTVGVFAFEDTIRDNAGECVQLLKRQGIQQTTMLTGDHEIVARNVADQLGIDDFDAGLTPAGKLERLNTLREKHGTLVLVGDGINDAPALAHADVGVAMGSIGTDLALEAADIVLLKDRIERVAWLHRHAKRTASIVRQNLTLAIAVIATLSVLAVAGYIPLPIAVIGHEGSTVVVALNALRLLRTKTD